MTPQRLDRVLTAYRIGDPDGLHPIFDATGSTLYPGRWNTPAAPILYAAEHYSTAMLEKLAHGSGSLPPNQHFIAITIPNGIPYEMLEPAHLPGWDDPICAAAKAFGATWQRSRRSLLLIVPSIVARMEHNFLLNPEHAAFPQVTHSLHRPVWWDARLFASGGAPEATETIRPRDRPPRSTVAGWYPLVSRAAASSEFPGQPRAHTDPLRPPGATASPG